MASTPWIVRRTKQGRASTTPAPRERAHISDDVGRKKSTGARSKNQKTLTQIQWIVSPDIGLEDDLDLQEIGIASGEQQRALQLKRRKLNHEDSTLTQMDWLGGTMTRKDETPNDLDQPSESGGRIENKVPQLDGTFDSPAKKKKRKSMPSPEPLQSSSPTSMERETQDYLPSKRRKKTQTQSPCSTSPRRKSRRIASKEFSDHQTGLRPINQTLIPQSSHKSASRRKQTPKLEVMDTFEFEDEETPTQHFFQTQTPQRQREIPSSQTPETLPRSKKRQRQGLDMSPSQTARRKPLGERSVNLPSVSRQQGSKLSRPVHRRLNLSPVRSKICVLKIPSQKLRQRFGQTHNLEEDIYSIQATSSTEEASKPSSPIADAGGGKMQTAQPEDSIEIPATTQHNSSSDRRFPSSPPNAGMDGSLPELTDLIPSRKKNFISDDQNQLLGGIPTHQGSGNNPSIVRDFGQPKSSEIDPLQNVENEPLYEPDMEDNDVMLLDEELGGAEPDLSLPTVTNKDSDRDDCSDFGSPVANDTQFNTGLLERTSSPDVRIQQKDTENNGANEGAPKCVNFVSSLEAGGNRDNNEEETESPMPTPRLVRHLRSPIAQMQLKRAGSNNAIDYLPSTYEPESNALITKVPLNDTMIQSAPSSPILPPFRPSTQQSVHPASMPRPSQVSTQDPTQAFPFSSLHNPTQRYNDLDRITIKDSSSVQLHQIPLYETQGQRSHLQVVDETDDEIDDLDLDPSSAPLSRQSARKPTPLVTRETGSSLRPIRPLSALQRNQTGSSLRSIHLSSDKSSDKNAELVPSSSPSLRSSKPRDTNKDFPDTDRTPTQSNQTRDSGHNKTHEAEDDQDATSSPVSSPTLQPLKYKHAPIPGFDNETQSNFTQNGHVTAAYVHRQRETGAWPDWFVPEPFQLPGWKRSRKNR